MINEKALEATREFARRTQPEINPAPEWVPTGVVPVHKEITPDTPEESWPSEDQLSVMEQSYDQFDINGGDDQ